ncbi:type IV toxin-antitoxin system AbiEi family antitoxin domain-containing protein, partial [Kitasatospora sp. NPDC101235]
AIVEHLATAGGPVRAGDIARALGRDASASAINAVRTSLERLTKAGRAERVGRGLYQAATS